MKKVLSFVLCLCIVLSLSACGNDKTEDFVITVPDGAPALCVLSLDGKVIDGKKIKIEIVSEATTVIAKIKTGEAGAGVLPTNVACKSFNNGVKIRLLTVNVFGVLYMVATDGTNVTSLSDLKNKTVYNIGVGGTPDLTLKHLLSENGIGFNGGIDEVTLEYVSSASELIPLLKKKTATLGILGQPAVQQANLNAGTHTVIDLQAEYKKIHGNDSVYPQAGVVVGESVYDDTDFLKELTTALNSNLAELKSNPSAVQDKLIGLGSALRVNFTTELLDACNLGCMFAESINDQITTYFNVIQNFDSTFIGGKLPTDAFYVENYYGTSND